MIRSIRDCLIRKARAGETLTYEELHIECGISADFSIPGIHAVLTHRLKHILSHELKKGRPLLTILVRKNGSDMPSDKFFILTKELGIQSEDLDDSVFFKDKLKSVFETWGDNRFYNHFKDDF